MLFLVLIEVPHIFLKAVLPLLNAVCSVVVYSSQLAVSLFSELPLVLRASWIVLGVVGVCKMQRAVPSHSVLNLLGLLYELVQLVVVVFNYLLLFFNLFVLPLL